MLQILGKPEWVLNPLINGQPNFETLKPYMPKKFGFKAIGQVYGRDLFGPFERGKEIKKASQFLERLDFNSSGDWTRTSDLRVMSRRNTGFIWSHMY